MLYRKYDENDENKYENNFVRLFSENNVYMESLEIEQLFRILIYI